MGPTSKIAPDKPTNIIYVDKLQETIDGLKSQRDELVSKIHAYQHDLPILESQRNNLNSRISILENIFAELDQLQLTHSMYIYSAPKLV